MYGSARPNRCDVPHSLPLDRFRRRVQAARPARQVCAGCGTKSDNDRWSNAAASREPGHRWHPTLRETCEERAVAAADQAERDRSEAAAAATAENARG